MCRGCVVSHFTSTGSERASDLGATAATAATGGTTKAATATKTAAGRLTKEEEQAWRK